MLKFYSASVRAANSERAIAECLEMAFEQGDPSECSILVIYATLGHKLDRLAAAAKKIMPQAKIVGNSCAGTIGKEGVGESMNEVAVMAICGDGPDYALAGTKGIYGHNSYEKALEMAQSLKAQNSAIHTIKLLTPGIDITQDAVLQAFVEVFGEEVNIFGGSSSDNMRGIVTTQYYLDEVEEHQAWAIGIADPSLGSVTRAAHGFVAYGLPMVVTKAEGNIIYELDHRPALEVYLERLSLPDDAICEDIIPIGAMAEKLSAQQAEEYGNSHILRVVTKIDRQKGYLVYPVLAKEGTEIWLTQRDEDLIFREQARALQEMQKDIGGRQVVAAFQTDCLARGRFMFNRVMKEELVGLIQSGVAGNHDVPPWLGMYGFGEYAMLCGKNTYHNYSTSLLAIYQK